MRNIVRNNSMYLGGAVPPPTHTHIHNHIAPMRSRSRAPVWTSPNATVTYTVPIYTGSRGHRWSLHCEPQPRSYRSTRISSKTSFYRTFTKRFSYIKILTSPVLISVGGKKNRKIVFGFRSVFTIVFDRSNFLFADNVWHGNSQ